MQSHEPLTPNRHQALSRSLAAHACMEQLFLVQRRPELWSSGFDGVPRPPAHIRAALQLPTQTCCSLRNGLPPSSLSCLAAVKHEYKSGSGRVLCQYRRSAFGKNGLIRHVTAELKPCENVVREQMFVSSGDSVQV